MTTVAYNTSKGAVVNFTRALACEWGKYGITVNAICPGFFPSKMTKGTLEALGADKLAEHAPLGRLGDDEDLKGAVRCCYASMPASTSPASGWRWTAASASARGLMRWPS
jgi:NAD(P)-dependent dehydrogenase (short-subunit alcohol dehydrogenase family)